MKKLLAAIVIASSFLISAQALHAESNKASPNDHAERVVDRMSERLDLTEDQKNNILSIKKEEFEKVRSLREENKKRIEGLLTEEQLEKRNTKTKECKRGDHHKKGHKEGGYRD